MKRIKKKSDRLRTPAAILLCALLLSSCMRKPAAVSESAGVGRSRPDDPLTASEHVDEPSDPADPSGMGSGGQSSGGQSSGEQSSGGQSSGEQSSGGRNPGGQTGDPGQQNPQEQQTSSGSSGSSLPEGQTWAKVNGKYVYNLPKRDTSGLATVDEMYATPNVPMEDQPDDWYPGKWEYDEYSGEASLVWDRWPSVLEIIDKYHAVYTGDETRKVCYLTFDCGYEYGTTGKILDTLKEKEAPALFFLTGDYVDSEYDLMKRMLDEGHLVGNHTVDHVPLTEVSVDEFRYQLDELEKMFYEQFPDAQPMIYFRPPKGSCNEWVFKLADKMGYHTVMWSGTYKDYDVDNQWTFDEAYTTLQSQLRPGVVYLLHAESVTNTQILGPLIDWIRAQGYEILPMCDYEP